MSVGYAVIVPVRDEAHDLPRLLEALERQTVLPEACVIVDTGSSDGSVEAARRWATGRPWAIVISIEAVARSRGQVVPAAIESGLAHAGGAGVVVKLDADVSLAPDYFEALSKAFECDPRLGVASGRRLEWSRGAWRERRVTAPSVESQCRAYRRECLSELLPLQKRKGWDGIDVLRAAALGWQTRVIPELVFRHHRSIGARERSRFSAWWEEGEAAHYMGYRPTYLAVRALYHSMRDPAALAMFASFCVAAFCRRAHCSDLQARGYLRREQRLRRLLKRTKEKTGLGSAGRSRTELLLVADPGGHLAELLALDELWSRFSRVWVTVASPGIQNLSEEEVILAHGPTQRSVWNLLRNTAMAVRVLHRHRPSVILTTGAALAVPFGWVGKLFGARVVYIECSGRIGVSLSGRLLSAVADRFYLQWPHVSARVRGALYRGSIFFSTK
jgi:glycosyltransferase involved in cell wall biosynthesis